MMATGIIDVAPALAASARRTSSAGPAPKVRQEAIAMVEEDDLAMPAYSYRGTEVRDAYGEVLDFGPVSICAPGLAEVSTRLADLTILTAEDPRTESLDQILEEMALGAAAGGGVEGQTFWRVADRGDALRLAVGMAREGDVLIACGKGHEQSMCFGNVEYAWDDRIALQAALAERLGVTGPGMPYLPTQDKAEAEWLS